VHVEGARPGDTLAVEVLEIETADWGWAGIIPGEGLLPADFPDPYLRIFDLTAGHETRLREDIAIRLDPFLGVMGTCPAGARGRPVMPPGAFGGNLDVRHLTRGSTLYLPVELDGALFSCGDAHAAQGDGEVCVTAIETRARARLRLTVEQSPAPPAPRFVTPVRRADSAPRFGTTGVGPDLYAAAQDAIRSMIDHLVQVYGLSPEDAYVLCSLVVDLTISEAVDAGVYVVSALLPLAVFDRHG
jgi:acetamidase/formamidase